MDLFGGQIDWVSQKKRNAILKQLSEQKEEERMLDRTKRELLDDYSSRYLRNYESRKELEKHWRAASASKKNRERN
ncbi:coiled-coil domain-containing protein 81-like [Mizuhopecten yessoensis]|uniref:Uncharacterized protein n=1 Tax=Mizuhopecten yessoensis TaxID=6573 RepID=A0A210QQH0_MIZYE|nr:coiled-coil domain-containing protein 81-like [Mizuhopecten yessoensis]OWF50938.1 hypothetical protein KP79_PYT07463 [Mizuhopecten yessoensis]